MNRVLRLIEAVLRYSFCIIGTAFLLIGFYALIDTKKVIDGAGMFAEDAVLENDFVDGAVG